jgi:hypothetical protein
MPIISKEQIDFLLSKDGTEISVDWSGCKDAIPANYKECPVWEFVYPAQLKIRFFPKWLDPTQQEDA